MMGFAKTLYPSYTPPLPLWRVPASHAYGPASGALASV